MGQSDFQRLRQLIEELLQKPQDERRAALETACADQPELLPEALELLRAAETEEHSLAFSMGPQPGQELGPFVVKRLIASGGMGSVFEAQQKSPSRRVAIKWLKPERANQKALRRFQYEIEVLARLRHPAIATIFDTGTSSLKSGNTSVEIPWFAMEFVEGARPITKFVLSKQLSIDETCRLFLSVCEGIAHGHQHGVIHRDLKPENLLVDENGRIKIIDFGIARATDSDLGLTTAQTEVGSIIGTLPYMSPEQVSGDAHGIDLRSDVYSLGVVLYQLLTGELPYEFSDVAQLGVLEAVRTIQTCEPKRPSAVRKVGTGSQTSKLPGGDLETILLKALRKDPDQRYASVGDLAGDLQSYLRREPIQARRPSLTYQLKLLARRNKVAVAALAFVFLASLAATAISVHYALRANQSTALAKESASQAEANAVLAEESAILAEQRFEETRGLARSLMYEVYDEIKDIAGTSQARELIAKNSLIYLDSLRIQAEDHEDLALDVADGYQRLGSLQGSPNFANLGQPEEGLVSLNKALGILDQLLAKNPTHGRALFRQMAILNIKEPILRAQGQTDEAAAISEQTLELARRYHVSDADPEERTFRLLAGLAFASGADRAAGRWERSMTRLQEAIGISKELLEIAPDNLNHRRNQTILLNNVGDMAMDSRDLALAQASYIDSRNTVRELLSAAPDNGLYRRDLASTCTRLARVENSLHDRLAAAAAFEEALAAVQALVDADPNVPLGYEDMCSVQEQLALFWEGEDPERAIAHAREFVKASQALAELDSDNPRVPLYRGRSQSILGKMLFVNGEVKAGEASLRAGLALLRKPADQNPNDVDSQLNYLTCVAWFADVLMDAEQHADTIALLKPVAERLPASASDAEGADLASDTDAEGTEEALDPRLLAHRLTTELYLGESYIGTGDTASAQHWLTRARASLDEQTARGIQVHPEAEERVNAALNPTSPASIGS